MQCTEDCDCAPEVEARGPLPGVRERQRIRAERSESAGADCGAGAAGVLQMRCSASYSMDVACSSQLWARRRYYGTPRDGLAHREGDTNSPDEPHAGGVAQIVHQCDSMIFHAPPEHAISRTRFRRSTGRDQDHSSVRYSGAGDAHAVSLLGKRYIAMS